MADDKADGAPCHGTQTLGNQHFARGLYREATEAYTNAIECIGDEVDWQEASSRSGNLAVYYSNRAACWLKRKQFQKAIDDCSEVTAEPLAPSRSRCCPHPFQCAEFPPGIGVSLCSHASDSVGWIPTANWQAGVDTFTLSP